MLKLKFIVTENIIDIILKTENIFKFIEIFIIGDQKPLSWSSKEFKLMKENNNYSIEIEFEKAVKLKYKYLFRFISRTGEEIHYLDIFKTKNYREIITTEKQVEDKILKVGKIPIIETKKRKVCRFPFQNPVIAYNGDVTVCCADNEFKLKIGNVCETPISQLWNFPLIEKYRMWQIRADFKWMEHCYSCVSFRENPLEDNEIYEYLKKVNKLDEYYFYLRRMYGKYSLKYLMIELTDICNLNCIMCNQKYNKKVHNIENGFIEKEKVFKVCKDLQKENIFLDTLSLFWMGESFLHKDFCEIVKKIDKLNTEKPFYSILEVHTSGNKFNENIYKELENVKIRILFSVDANTEKTYNKIKNGGNFNKVISNILKYIEKLPKKHQIVIQFIVMNENSEEAVEFKDFWENKFKKFNINSQTTMYYDWCRQAVIFFRSSDALKENEQNELFNIYNETVNKLELKNRTWNEFIPVSQTEDITKISHKKPCFSIFEFLVIRHDGDVTVCCHDIEGKLSIGNLNNNSFKEILNGDKLQNLRISHIKGNIPKLCEQCFVNNSKNAHLISDKIIIDWLKSIKRYDLIEEYLKKIFTR